MLTHHRLGAVPAERLELRGSDLEAIVNGPLGCGGVTRDWLLLCGRGTQRIRSSSYEGKLSSGLTFAEAAQTGGQRGPPPGGGGGGGVGLPLAVLVQATLVLAVCVVLSANVICASNGHFPVEQPVDTKGA
jgi:hypothetical protein